MSRKVKELEKATEEQSRIHSEQIKQVLLMYILMTVNTFLLKLHVKITLILLMHVSLLLCRLIMSHIKERHKLYSRW